MDQPNTEAESKYLESVQSPPRSVFSTTASLLSRNSESVSFNEKVRGHKSKGGNQFSAAVRALLSATNTSGEAADNGRESLFTNSSGSGTSDSSGSVVQVLQPERTSILSDEAGLKAIQRIDNDIKILITTKINEFVSPLFSHNIIHAAFASELIRKGFYSKKATTSSLSHELSPESIRQQRTNLINAATAAAQHWLRLISLTEIVRIIHLQVAQYYIDDTFGAVLFEQFLLNEIIRHPTMSSLRSYSSARDMLFSIFSDSIILSRQQEFSEKLRVITTYVPASIPLRKICDFLWKHHHILHNKIIAEEDLEAGIADDPPCYRGGPLLARDFNTALREKYCAWKKEHHDEQALIADLSQTSLSKNGYFKSSRCCGPLVFKTYEDIQQDKIDAEDRKYLVLVSYALGAISAGISILFASKKEPRPTSLILCAIFSALTILFIALGLYVRWERNKVICEALQTLALFPRQSEYTDTPYAHTEKMLRNPLLGASLDFKI
ncbi:MAG: hypothetical protein KBD83_06540 [Gammaproteobacteria bacterium]|nr:hypothetical protein [Gammaproteobacteria bacterium]